MKHTVNEMISGQEISQRISELAQQITQQYHTSDNGLVLIGLLRGSFVFMADLCRHITVDHQIDFITASSYGDGMVSTRDVKIMNELSIDVCGKDILIIEDIIDSGFTLHKVCEYLRTQEPESISICTLLDKPSRREVDVEVNYVGFSIPDKFVVGYGIDYAQNYRHLPYIGVVTSDA